MMLVVMASATPVTDQACTSFESCSDGKDLYEFRLIKHLMERYEQWNAEKAGRPVLEHADVVTVKYGLGLIDILNYDEANRIMKVVAWDKMEWNDALLKWDPSEYGGIGQIRLPAFSIWNADITLFNSVNKHVHVNDAEVLVYSSGTVIFIPSLQREVKCSEQSTPGFCKNITCEWKFGSWVYSNLQLDIQFYNDKAELDLEDYNKDFRYALVESRAVREDKKYDCCEELYPSITYTTVFNKITDAGFCETAPMWAPKP